MRYLFLKIIVIVILLGNPFSIHSQNFNYSVSTSNSGFVLLTDSVKTIIDDGIWDDNSYMIPIGFSFTFAGHSFDSVEVGMNGTFSFGNDDKYCFVAFFKDFICESDLNNNLSLSPVSRELCILSGGEKRLKIEFKNAGFINSSGQMAHVSFQVWLNQQDNSIELHVGIIDTTVPNETCIIGLLNMKGGESPLGHLLEGNPGNPSGVAIPQGGNISMITNMPSTGTVYIFNPNAN